MKKILLSIVAMMAVSMGAYAQYAHLYKGSTLVNQYSKDVVDRVEFSQTNANILNGHEYVEIGSKKWATMNIGATTVAGSCNTCYGNYYAWGFTDTYLSKYTLSDAKTISSAQWKRNDYSSTSGAYCTGNDTYSKYVSYSEATLEPIDDAATAAWGATWRMPKQADFQALVDACLGSNENGNIIPTTPTAAITTGGIYWLSADQTFESAYTGVVGVLFVDKTDISKRVFFPAAGRLDGTKFLYGGEYGTYRSSSVVISSVSSAYCLGFDPNSVRPESYGSRYYGFSVRPVSD